MVRRERERNGRVYRISFTATDQEGATCQGVVRVCVPPSRTKVECVEDPLVFDSLGPCPAGTVLATAISQVDQRGSVILVDYTTAQAAEVRLELFDIAGRRVGTLMNETVAGGTHSVAWNAGRLSKGLYFLRMRSGDVQEVRRTFIR